MPDFNTLKSLYFVQAADATPPQEPVPLTFSGCKITPLYDGALYAQAISEELDKVGKLGDFILIASWQLGLLGGKYTPPTWIFSPSGPEVSEVPLGDYFLDGPPPIGGKKHLASILKEKAKKGVDVRVLAWVSFGVMSQAITQLLGAGASVGYTNSITINSVKELRSEPSIGPKAILSVIGHTVGSVHPKMVIIGNETEAVGFTGGLDFMINRWAHFGHPGEEFWHDVAAKVEGPAVQAMYDLFKDMWFENISQPARLFSFEGEEISSHMPNKTPVLPARKLSAATKGKHHIQSLRTVPKQNYSWYNCLPEGQPVSFAPIGLFEVRTAWRTAILTAGNYIYMEDQYFWSQEVLSWVNATIKVNSDLRVILIAPGAPDPADPEIPKLQLLGQSINHGLLMDLTAEQRNQVRMFKCWGDANPSAPFKIKNVDVDSPNSWVSIEMPSSIPSGIRHPMEIILSMPRSEYKYFWLQVGSQNFPVIGMKKIPADGGPPVLLVQNLPGSTEPISGTTAQLLMTVSIFVHAKTMLIDDRWAMIGSTNFARRDLYTDWNHSVSFMDEDAILVKEYRKALWAEHFYHFNYDDLDDIQAALHGWDNSWGVPGTAPAYPVRSPDNPGRFLEPVPLPLIPELPFEPVKSQVDWYIDPDSREAWGGLCPKI